MTTPSASEPVAADDEPVGPGYATDSYQPGSFDSDGYGVAATGGSAATSYAVDTFETGSDDSFGWASSYRAGAFEAGSSEAGSSEAGSSESGSYEPSSYEPTSYEPGSFGSGSYEPGSYSSGSDESGSDESGSHSDQPDSYQSASYESSHQPTPAEAGSFDPTGSYATGAYPTVSFEAGSVATDDPVPADVADPMEFTYSSGVPTGAMIEVNLSDGGTTGIDPGYPDDSPAPTEVSMPTEVYTPIEVSMPAEVHTPIEVSMPAEPAAAEEPQVMEPIDLDSLQPPEPESLDTVADAQQTPDQKQAFADLGLQDDEYEKIKKILGRRPTGSELAMYAVMWSEHCSYKSSKVHLRQFVEKAPRSDRLLAGMGHNAGVIQVSGDLAVTFKIESHNHPSFVAPHQGAATGVGGIVRDILAMGARPIAVMDSLRFGEPGDPDTARVLPGVVAGVGDYGNCLGLPNIGGELLFDACYQGNPLVNALCVGILPVTGMQSKAARGPGNSVVLLGAKTGRDGIGGASVLASATFGSDSPSRRPSVQVGDPFLEKLLIEACIQMYRADLIVGIQDLGAAGLACALSETSAAAGTGMEISLDAVPLREPSMVPHEILTSESQERMLLIVAPDKVGQVLSVAATWGIAAAVIGKVTPGTAQAPGRLVVSWQGQNVVDVPPGSLADDGPVYARPMREPNDLPLLQADRAETLPRPSSGDQLRATLLKLLASPNLCDKTWVTEQYDRYVLGNTVLAQPEDAGMLRLDEQSGLGIAISLDGNGRYARLDPYRGAQLALAEAYRNVAVTGATPVAVTDCLNLGSPEDPQVMWQLAEMVRGLADGCVALGIPVTGGNVSLYNQTGAVAVNPTAVVGVLGVLEDITQRVRMGFKAAGDILFLLGETGVELSGSEWAWVEHGHLGGRPPAVDFPGERRLADLIAAAAHRGLIAAAHDLSEGGLAQALAEACLRYGMGASIALDERDDVFIALFAESSGRALVAVPRGHDKAFAALAAEHELACQPLGTTGGGEVSVRGQFSIGLDELRQHFTGTLPELFGTGA